MGITNVGYWLKFNGLQYIKYYSYVHIILSSKVNKVPFSSVCVQEVNQNTLPDVADMSHIIMCKKQIGIIQTGCHCAVPCRPDPISPIVFPSCHRVTHKCFHLLHSFLLLCSVCSIVGLYWQSLLIM